MIESLQKLDMNVLERFLEVRDAAKMGIPQQLADYILQVNDASNLHQRYRSISECAIKLQKRYTQLSIHTCKKRIYDAINFFNSDCTVTTESWNLYFADRMEKLGDVNLVAHDLREARICYEKAREYRIAASSNAVDPDRTKFKPQLVSADMELPRMGIQQKGILRAWEKACKLIDDRDISEGDKERLRMETARELDIEEAEYEGA